MRAGDNPFSTNRVESVLQFDPQWIGTNWREIESHWLSLHKRAALIGPHGSGKTTFIDHFSQRMIDQGADIYRIFLNSESPKIHPDQWLELSQSSEKIIILDGEEQLSKLQRWRLYRLTRTSAGLLISRHSKGKLPILLEFEPKINILQHCVRKLSPEFYQALEPNFVQWWEEEHGNIRHVLLRCYDFIAKSPSP